MAERRVHESNPDSPKKPDSPKQEEAGDNIEIMRQRALDRITRDYQTRQIHRALSFLVQDNQEIDDTVHNVFLGFQETLERYTDIEKLKGMVEQPTLSKLYRQIFRHLRADQKREQSRKGRRSHDSEYDDERNVDPQGLAAYDTAEYLMDLKSILDRIPDDDEDDDKKGKRFKILLSGVLVGRRNQDIAAELKVTPSRVAQLWKEYAVLYKKKRILPDGFPKSIEEFNRMAGRNMAAMEKDRQEGTDEDMKELIPRLFSLYESLGNDHEILKLTIKYILSLPNEKKELNKPLQDKLKMDGAWSVTSNRKWPKNMKEITRLLDLARPFSPTTLAGFIERHPEFSFSAHGGAK